MPKRFYDIIVVGAGPSGSVCATRTAEAGLSTLVLEQHHAAGEFVNCTGIIGAEAFDLLELPRETILSSLGSLTFISPSGKRFHYDPDASLAHIVCRKKFDSTLANIATRAGAQFQYGVRARSLKVDTSGVEVDLGDGQDPLRANAIVIATGFGTNLPQQVGLKNPPHIIYGVQAEVPMTEMQSTEIYVGNQVAPHSFAWVVPVGEGRARVGMTVPKHAPHYFEQFMRSAHVFPRLQTNEWKMQLSLVPLGMMPRSYTDRVLVVGEAAGQVKTTTQGGIYYGMLCATFAAEVLREAAAKKDFGRKALSRYERLWQRKIGPEIRAGEHLRQLLTRLSDERLDELIALGTNNEVVDLVRKIAKFDWHKDIILSSLRLPILKELVRMGRF